MSFETFAALYVLVGIVAASLYNFFRGVDGGSYNSAESFSFTIFMVVFAFGTVTYLAYFLGERRRDTTRNMMGPR